MVQSPSPQVPRSGILDSILTTHKVILFITGAIVALLMFGQVVMRYVFSMSVYGVEELAVFFAFWVYFIGLAYTSWDDYHISADLVPLMTKSERVRKFFKIFSKGASVIIAGFMAYLASIQVLWFVKKQATTVELGIPLWIIYALICYGFAASAISFAIQFTELIKKRNEGEA